MNQRKIFLNEAGGMKPIVNIYNFFHLVDKEESINNSKKAEKDRQENTPGNNKAPIIHQRVTPQ